MGNTLGVSRTQGLECSSICSSIRCASTVIRAVQGVAIELRFIQTRINFVVSSTEP